MRGVGEKKLADLGGRFLTHIAAYCAERDLELDVAPPTLLPSRPRSSRGDAKRIALEMFAEGRSVEEVMAAISRARSTTMAYLAAFVESECPDRLDPWVDAETYRLVAEAARQAGSAYLKPIFDRLGGKVPYEVIRLVTTHLRVRGA